MLINEVYIYAPQDPSVGLFSVSLTIDLDGYEVTDEEDLEFVRKTFALCFGTLYDDTVQVVFDFEEVDNG